MTTDKLREALTELVEALDNAFISSWQSTAAWQKQLDAARAALAAQPAQAPFAWIDPADIETLEYDAWCVVHRSSSDPNADHSASIPLYLAAQPAQPGDTNDRSTTDEGEKS